MNDVSMYAMQLGGLVETIPPAMRDLASRTFKVVVNDSDDCFVEEMGGNHDVERAIALALEASSLRPDHRVYVGFDCSTQDEQFIHIPF